MYVPARVGGVDLSSAALLYLWMIAVPARVGGVDLSIFSGSSCVMACSPRPCGRGGFKRFEEWSECISENVPARVGGVDLSTGMWYFCHMM